MGFKFFHLPKHRVFTYTPMYYNQENEKFDKGNHVPGSIVSGGFKRGSFRSLPRKDGGYTKGRRIAVYILLAVILGVLFYFSKLFAHMLALLKIQIDA